jgi:hypothetical protein
MIKYYWMDLALDCWLIGSSSSNSLLQLTHLRLDMILHTPHIRVHHSLHTNRIHNCLHQPNQGCLPVHNVGLELVDGFLPFLFIVGCTDGNETPLNCLVRLDVMEMVATKNQSNDCIFCEGMVVSEITRQKIGFRGSHKPVTVTVFFTSLSYSTILT